MAVEFRELRSELLRYAPEAPTPLVIDMLREASREFFSRSHCWRESFNITLEDGEDTYELLDADAAEHPTYIQVDVDTGYFADDVVSWHEVIFDGKQRVTPRTRAELARSLPRSTAIFFGFENPTRSSIRLVGTPTAAEDTKLLNVTVSLMPSRQALQISSDEMVNAYKDIIVAGALFRLLTMSRQPWYDARNAMIYAARFEAGILDADNRAQTQYKRHIVRRTTYGGL